MRQKLLMTTSGIGLIVVALFASAHGAHAYQLLEPSFFTSSPGEPVALPDYVQRLYTFALWTIGIAAFLMLSIGAFWYVTSAGNNAQVETAKNIIRDALFGLIVVLLGVIILGLINPALVNVDLRGITSLRVDQDGSTPGGLVSGSAGGTGVGGGGRIAFSPYCYNQGAGTGSTFPSTNVACFNSLADCEDASGSADACGRVRSVFGSDLARHCARSGSGVYECFDSEGACAENHSECIQTEDIASEIELYGTLTEGEIRGMLQVPVCSSGENPATCTGDNTTVRGLPQRAIDGVNELNAACNCNLVITAGTDIPEILGTSYHQTHGSGRPIVDFRADPALLDYLREAASEEGGTVGRNTRGEEVFILPDGSRHTYETNPPHVHSVF